MDGKVQMSAKVVTWIQVISGKRSLTVVNLLTRIDGQVQAWSCNV